MTSPIAPLPAPALSVIIPVHNGGDAFDRCLGALRASATGDYELIVVDDASTDDSFACALRYGATVRRLDTRGGPARARNVGAEMARAAILVFLDADVCVHRDTLARLARHLVEQPDCVAVMGSYDDTPADPHFISQFKNLFHHFVHQHSSHRASTFWAGCGAIRRAAFTESGGFDVSYERPCIEDIELGARLSSRGWRLDLNPAIQVTHLKRWTLASLIRTDVRDRAVPWLLLMLRQGSMPADLNATPRHRLSVVLVAGLVLAIALAPLGYATAPLLLSLAVLLFVLNCDLYSFFLRRRGPWFALRAVPLHWLYYLYCGVAVVMALAIHFMRREAVRRARLRVDLP